MTGIVIKVDPVQGGGYYACSVEAPFEIVDGNRVSLVTLDEVLGMYGPDVVRKVGEGLALKLRENQIVDQVLNLVLAHPMAPPSRPIAFRIGDPAAHALSWEAFVGNNQFLALDGRWPITRIPRGGNVKTGARRPFAPPLRLVCVLSALGRPAIKEWNGIYRAVQDARANGLPVKVWLFAGEEVDVLDVVRGLDDPDVTLLPVPDQGSKLIDAVEKLQPHLVHFFCHGTVANRVRRLEIGSVNDFDQGSSRSSVIVLVEELGVAMWRAATWGVVLNTCRGADASEEGLTHAEDLVNKGVPFAVGMRRQVDAEDAFAFSAAFYPRALLSIASAWQGETGERHINWADTLLQARRSLRDMHGANADLNDAWTLPVLYTRPGDFALRVAESPDTDSAPLPPVPQPGPGLSPIAVERAAVVTLGEEEVVGGLVALIAAEASPELAADLRDLI